MVVATGRSYCPELVEIYAGIPIQALPRFTGCLLDREYCGIPNRTKEKDLFLMEGCAQRSISIATRQEN